MNTGNNQEKVSLLVLTEPKKASELRETIREEGLDDPDIVQFDDPELHAQATTLCEQIIGNTTRQEIGELIGRLLAIKGVIGVSEQFYFEQNPPDSPLQ